MKAATCDVPLRHKLLESGTDTDRRVGHAEGPEDFGAHYIVYKSRAHRDQVNAKVMKDPRIEGMGDPKDMPFDCKRMLYGGFKRIVEA